MDLDAGTKAVGMDEEEASVVLKAAVAMEA